MNKTATQMNSEYMLHRKTVNRTAITGSLGMAIDRLMADHVGWAYWSIRTFRKRFVIYVAEKMVDYLKRDGYAVED